jgi:phosphomevalonate kinase
VIRAPGKLFLTGAWGVLEGAPAIVAAVDRFAEASLEGEPSTMPEVLAVAKRLEAKPPHVDVSSMQRGGRKIGLGSSAAASVAAAGAILQAKTGAIDVDRVVDVAARAHRDVQPRGSGADVAACAHGGVVEVRREGDRLDVVKRALPNSLVWRVFSSSKPSSTRDALDRFAARRKEKRVDYALASIVDAAHVGAHACEDDDLDAFLAAARAHVQGLEHLSAALDLALVPFEVAMARDLLIPEKGAEMQAPPVLLPSGAGGGDTVVWLGARAPTDQEAGALERSGLVLLDLSLSSRGVHSDADRIA